MKQLQSKFEVLKMPLTRMGHTTIFPLMFRNLDGTFSKGELQVPNDADIDEVEIFVRKKEE